MICAHQPREVRRALETLILVGDCLPIDVLLQLGVAPAPAEIVSDCFRLVLRERPLVFVAASRWSNPRVTPIGLSRQQPARPVKGRLVYFRLDRTTRIAIIRAAFEKFFHGLVIIPRSGRKLAAKLLSGDVNSERLVLDARPSSVALRGDRLQQQETFSNEVRV